MNGRSAWMSKARRGLAAAAVAAVAVPLPALAAALTLTSEHLTTTATCALVSYPKTSTYSIDSFVDGGTPASNNGTVNQLKLQSQAGHNQRVYVKFPTTGCLFAPPAGSIVRSATLRLFEAGALPGVCRTYDVFRASGSWTETGITWTNQPEGTTSNQPASASRTASQDVGNPATCANHTSNAYVDWSVTSDVAAFLAGTATNDGWMIRDDAEDAATAEHVAFSAREQNNLAQAPQLLMTYTSV